MTEDLPRCNFCYLEDIRTFARSVNGAVVLQDDNGGVTVTIDNAFAVWFEALPTVCVCGNRRQS